MAFFAYKIWTTENIAKVYNPFEILDISTVSCHLPLRRSGQLYAHTGPD